MPKKKQITRRDLFKLGLSAGAAATFASTPFAAKSVRAQEDAPKKMSDATLPQVPRRVLGKTGETVPILLMGAAMKLTGSRPLVERQMIGEYAHRDISRTARRYGIAFNPPPAPFPLPSVAPCRAFYWLADRDPLQARDFARRTYAALFIDGRNVSEVEVVVALASSAGADADETRAALGAQAVKDRLRQETDAAIERGVFGSPFVIVDGEPFWGNDRLDDMAKWLETGGW